MDVEQQNAEQDETVELSPRFPLPDRGEDRR